MLLQKTENPGFTQNPNKIHKDEDNPSRITTRVQWLISNGDRNMSTVVAVAAKLVFSNKSYIWGYDKAGVYFNILRGFVSKSFTVVIINLMSSSAKKIGLWQNSPNSSLNWLENVWHKRWCHVGKSNSTDTVKAKQSSYAQASATGLYIRLISLLVDNYYFSYRGHLQQQKWSWIKLQKI